MRSTASRSRLVVVLALVAMVASGCAYVTRASVASDGTQVPVSSAGSYGNFISGDGRYALVMGVADNLVAGDTNGEQDVFRHDDVTGATIRVDLNAAGKQIAAGAYAAGFSADGDRVLLVTTAKLTAADQNDVDDLYVRDIGTGAIHLVSLRPDGAQLEAGHVITEPSLSRNGRYVAFFDSNPNVVGGQQILVRDVTAGTTSALGTSAFKTTLSISGDGKHVMAARVCEPTCNSPQILETYDWQGVSYPNVPPNPSVTDQSTDGRYLLFYVQFQGMFRFDRVTGASVNVTGPIVNSGAMSDDGRIFVFPSNRSDLVPGDTNGAPDYFAVDVLNGAIRRVNVDAAARQADAADAGTQLSFPEVDGPGRYATFSTKSANLVGDDTNGIADVYVADAAHPMPTSVTPSTVARGAQHAVLTVAGGFLLDSSSFDLGPGITVESVAHLADGSQRVTVSVAAGAATGKRDVAVSVPGAMGPAVGKCFGCLTVS